MTEQDGREKLADRVEVFADDIGPCGDKRKLRIVIHDGRIDVSNLLHPDGETLQLSRPVYGYELVLARALASRSPAPAPVGLSDEEIARIIDPVAWEESPDNCTPTERELCERALACRKADALESARAIIDRLSQSGPAGVGDGQ